MLSLKKAQGAWPTLHTLARWGAYEAIADVFSGKPDGKEIQSLERAREFILASGTFSCFQQS